MINQSNQQADKQQHADGGEGAHTQTHSEHKPTVSSSAEICGKRKHLVPRFFVILSFSVINTVLSRY